MSNFKDFAGPQDIRQPTNKTLLEETLLQIASMQRDINSIKTFIHDIKESIAIKQINEDKLQQGQNLDDSSHFGAWWSPF